MSDNKIATFTNRLTYPGPDEETVRAPDAVVEVPFQSQSSGTVDIPGETAADEIFPIPFGAVDSATGLEITNRTSNVNGDEGEPFEGQELKVKINGQGPIFHIPPGGRMKLEFPSAPESCPVTSMCLVTTDTQLGPGLIGYKIFGDPIAPEEEEP